LRPDRLRIVLAGMLAGTPGHGGASWAVGQWILGLRRLGHDVLFVEPVDLLTPERRAYFTSILTDFGAVPAALVTPERASVGVPYDEVAAFAQRADVVVNVAGTLDDDELRDAAAVRVYLDLDPAFTQLWSDVGKIDMRLDGHTHHVTVGLNIGRPECTIPACGLTWRHSLPPVVLDEWPVTRRSPDLGLTTVANWRGYGSIVHDGVQYGQKAHSWRELMDLPRRVTVRCEPALGIHPHEVDDLHAFRSAGWRLLDPAVVASSPAAYRRFVQASWAELGVAKQGYVASWSGWFSDRSACYLASGRPVLAQDTGFSEHLPTDAGLLTFGSVDDAALAVETLAGDYERHRIAAREVAEAHLDSDRVITRFIEELR
jgi:hypothetical protein